MLNETHRALPRYQISDFFSSLLGSWSAWGDYDNAERCASRNGRRNAQNPLTSIVSVYTFTNDMGRPRITHHDRRSKLFPLRLSPRETAFFSRKARHLREVAPP